jgi:hypothetical protein
MDSLGKLRHYRVFQQRLDRGKGQEQRDIMPQLMTALATLERNSGGLRSAQADYRAG